MASPLGLDLRDGARLRFSWALGVSAGARGVTQAAYEIEVAAAGSGALLWGSGKVASNASSFVAAPEGVALAPETAYGFGVRWWDDGAAAPSAWANGTFSSGLLSPDGTLAWGGAEWIGAPPKAPGPGLLEPGTWLRATFALPSAAPLARAALHVAGAGWYACTLDGARIDDHVMGATTTFWNRLYYETYDVAPLLRERGGGARRGGGGDTHVLACALAKGWWGHEGNSIGATMCAAGAQGCPPALRALLTLAHADLSLIHISEPTRPY